MTKTWQFPLLSFHSPTVDWFHLRNTNSPLASMLPLPSAYHTSLMAEDVVRDPTSPPRLCKFTTQVHKAVDTLDLAALESLLTPENVNQCLCSGTTAVFLVAASCQDIKSEELSKILDILRFLHQLGANVNAESEGWPRDFSFDHKHPLEIPSPPDAPKRTPIVKAVSVGERTVAKLLLVHGANVGLGPTGLDDQGFNRLARGPSVAKTLPRAFVLPPACQFPADVHRAAQ
ncbi:hypothetical protein DL96DRAFT_1690694 [Flagelloscypha sp. PMI_526]|nr:hypothetical protein DL96DRAFT_1690694 [Flagelloscypha sp. PMI_526]